MLAVIDQDCRFPQGRGDRRALRGAASPGNVLAFQKLTGTHHCPIERVMLTTQHRLLSGLLAVRRVARGVTKTGGASTTFGFNTQPRLPSLPQISPVERPVNGF